VDADFSPIGRMFATLTGNRGDATPTIRVWDLTTGEPLTPILQSSFGRRLGSVRFLGGGKGLLWFTRRTNESQTWRLDRMDASNEELKALSQLLSCRKVSSSGDSIRISSQELDRLWRQLWPRHPEWFFPSTQ